MSVVIPTRNRLSLLMRAVAGVAAQTHHDLEVVVVDGGSGDGTVEWLASLDRSLVRCVHQGRAAGVPHARNLGVDAASGEWIAYLDDDDFWAPAKLEATLGAARATGRRAAYSAVVSVDITGRALRPPDHIPAADLSRLLPTRNCVYAGCSSVVVERRLQREVGRWDESLLHVADWDMWLRILRTGPFADTPRVLAAYSRHEGNQTHSLRRSMLGEMIRLQVRRSGPRVRNDWAVTLPWLGDAAARGGALRRAAAFSAASAVLTRDRAHLHRALERLRGDGGREELARVPAESGHHWLDDMRGDPASHRATWDARVRERFA